MPSFKPLGRSPDSVPEYEIDYALKCREKDHNFHASKRGVDQESYVYQLAVDMGAAPTWTYVLKEFGSEVFFTWAMGPNFTTKSRLVGPWSDERSRKKAARLMSRDGELGVVVRRTGGGVFLPHLYDIPFDPVCTYQHPHQYFDLAREWYRMERLGRHAP